MTDEQKSQDVPELISVGAQAIADTGKRLGLTWNLRPGMVAVTNPLQVIHDGDNEPIGMVSLIGFLGLGVRVMTMFVPPAGNYVVGCFAGGDVGRATFLEYAISTADQNITNVEANVPGLTITITTTAPNARFEAEGIFDFEETAAGGTTLIGRLYVDSVLQSATAVFKVASTNDRQTTPQNWAGTLPVAGTHVFQSRVVRSAAAGTQVANATNTTLRVKIYE